MKIQERKCPYCDGSGTLVRHSHFHGTLFVKCPYCEKKTGITGAELVALLVFTFVLAWIIAVAVTMLFN